ncbi:MAG TPA: metallophosphoesterase family protein [Anaerolineae bacterium]|nr:metallophosphoesterase family protein [Anaerolineae bacterium]
MRLAILSDIHGNSIALDAVLADLRSQGSVDAIWVLGDLAAIGPDPVGVLDRLSTLENAVYVRGNTDKYVTTGERPGPTAEEARTDPRRLARLVELERSFRTILFALMVVMLAACVQAPIEPTAHPTHTSIAATVSVPSVTATTTVTISPPTSVPVTLTAEPPAVTAAARVFSDCPLPAREGAGHPASKLRLVYVIQGNLWLLDEGQEPALLMGSGDVEEVLLSPDGSLIVFARQRDEHTAEVWAVNPSGEPPRRLSGEQGLPGSIDFISFSNDQELVAFYRLADPDNRELWVVYTNGAGVRRLVSLEDLRALEGGAGSPAVFPYRVTWIPGTHRLTYVPVLFYGGDVGEFFEPVHLVDAATGEQSVLFPEGEGGHITYSPDGKMMVIVDPSRVRRMNVDAPGDPQTVIRYSSLGFGGVGGPFIPQPAWTPDSSSFLLALGSEGITPDEFMFVNQGPHTIWEVSGDGSTTRKLGEFSDTVGSFYFSPDLKRVAYYRMDNTWDLHIANVDGSEDVLYDSLQEPEFHGWAPDSQHFAYSRLPGQFMYGDICGAASPVTNVTDAQFLGWLDAPRFLFWGDGDLYLGTVGGKSTRLVKFAASEVYVYDYVLIPR